MFTPWVDEVQAEQQQNEQMISLYFSPPYSEWKHRIIESQDSYVNTSSFPWS